MSQDIVLAVDLDRTLTSTDILYESFWESVSKDLRGSARAATALLAGKAQFKEALLRNVKIDAAKLPYNEAVLDYISNWREQGGKVVLVTATDQSVATAVAAHLGLFDEAFGSSNGRNLKGKAKADFLVERYGEGKFDYIGDSSSDLPIWKLARNAIYVGNSSRLRDSIRSLSGEVTALGDKPTSFYPYIKALRPHQWVKNALIFLPAVAAHSGDASVWFASLFAFLAFSVVASSVYVLNDLLDLSADRDHPRKRHRPLASGALPLEHGTFLFPVLLLIGAFFALLVGRAEFILVLLLYYVITFAYSLSLKRKMVIDICTLAGLYTIRIIAGAAATGLPLSVWLLAFSMFFFLSLAAVKRQAELVDAINSGRETLSGRGYQNDDLPMISMMSVSSGYVAVLVMALYVNSLTAQELYSNPNALWGVCPILLYWISRVVLLAHRGHMHDDPIVFAVRDRTSHFCGVLVLAVVLVGII